MKKMFSAIVLSALIASPLMANYAQFDDKPFANCHKPKKERGLLMRGINCCWQLTKFFGGLGTIGIGTALGMCSCGAFTCGKIMKNIACDPSQGYGGLDVWCDAVGTQCGKGGMIGTPILWYLGWKSMKSGWNGLTEK